MTKKKPRTIDSEWELAIWTALWFWRGTSITDGAFAVLAEVRRYNSSLPRTEKP